MAKRTPGRGERAAPLVLSIIFYKSHIILLSEPPFPLPDPVEILNFRQQGGVETVFPREGRILW
jgi:hypothetical protein